MSNPFNILGDQSHPPTSGQEQKEENQSAEINERIKSLIDSSDLFLFMKGSPEAPQCGFSANTCAVLNSFGVPYKTFNVLSDMDMRQGIKEYSNWPTSPQLYIKGQFVGGNDIIMELYETGELLKMLQDLMPK